MAHGDFIDLNRRRAADKILRGKAFIIAKNPKYYGNQRGLASVIYKYFDRKIFLVEQLKMKLCPIKN